MIGRRSFITGLISLVAAPAIVRAGSLMPVKMVEFNFKPTQPYTVQLTEAYRPWFFPDGYVPSGRFGLMMLEGAMVFDSAEILRITQAPERWL